MCLSRICVRIFDLLGDAQKSDEDVLGFAEDVVKKLDVNPRDGKITKGWIQLCVQ